MYFHVYFLCGKWNIIYMCANYNMCGGVDNNADVEAALIFEEIVGDDKYLEWNKDM